MAYKKNGVEFRLDSPGIDTGDLYRRQAYSGGNVTSDELRKEYSRLRQVANKRLKRMEGTRFEDSQTYKKNAGRYNTIADIEKQALANAKQLNPEAAQRLVDIHIARKMEDMYRFLTAKSGSIRGMQAIENQIIESLRERGLTFVNKKNIQQFGEYMEYLRSINKGREFDSERAADLFGTAIKKGINPAQIAEDFEYWKTREKELSQLPKIKNPKKRTADDYKRLLEDNTPKKRRKK